MGRFALILVFMLLLSGCAPATNEMYSPPKRSEEFRDLQSVIDEAMVERGRDSRLLPHPISLNNRKNDEVRYEKGTNFGG